MQFHSIVEFAHLKEWFPIVTVFDFYLHILSVFFYVIHIIFLYLKPQKRYQLIYFDFLISFLSLKKIVAVLQFYGFIVCCKRMIIKT